MARELIDREKTIYEVKQLFCKLIDANIFQMDVVDMAAAVAKKYLAYRLKWRSTMKKTNKKSAYRRQPVRALQTLVYKPHEQYTTDLKMRKGEF